MNNEICYRCGENATSQEHVPPQCLFPTINVEGKSVLRVNLITVPSCKDHNHGKSNEDEFLRNALAGIVGNNIVAYYHNKTKVRRSLERKTGEKSVKTILQNPMSTTWTDKNGITHEVFQGEFDSERLFNSFESIAYGLYYYEKKEVFKGQISIVPGFVKSNNQLSEQKRLLCEKTFERDSKNWPIKGDNPEVFFYQMGSADEYGLIPLKITFYQGTSIYVTFIPHKSKLPSFNLISALIEGGQKVFVKVDGANTIEFN
ncbi:MAG: hypothetical protein ACXVPN_04835 [Bacteroidia bacterium]